VFCRVCQGFHFLADTYDGFGGLAAALMDDIADEFSGKSVLTFSLTPPVFADYVTDYFCVTINFRLLLLISGLTVWIQWAAVFIAKWERETNKKTLYNKHQSIVDMLDYCVVYKINNPCLVIVGSLYSENSQNPAIAWRLMNTWSLILLSYYGFVSNRDGKCSTKQQF